MGAFYRAVWLAGFVVCGCASDAEPVDCHAGDVRGDYYIEYTPVSGDCGELGAAIVTVDGVAGAGCTEAVRSRSADECTATAAAVCETADGLVVDGEAELVQLSDDGRVIGGSVSMTIYDAFTGELVCSGAYTLSGSLAGE
jgi:hypothetical protein